MSGSSTRAFWPVLGVFAATAFANAGPPFFATGIKIGEVTPTSAVVWVRLTRDERPVRKDGPMPRIVYHGPGGQTAEQRPARSHQWTPEVVYPEGVTVATIAGAAPGIRGEVRVWYQRQGEKDWQETPWQPVDPAHDFTTQIPLNDLRPNTRYEVRAESRGGSKEPGTILKGGFRTAPKETEPARVVFTVSTGQEYADQDADEGGFRIYDSMLRLEPSFFVHTGDIVYFDALAKDLELARWHWARTYSLPTNVRFHRQVASYFMKDDHDTWQNDCWPTMTSTFMGRFTFAQGQAVFREQAPIGDLAYRTFRWGKDLQIWLVEGRDFRSANTNPDGPDKTIWGAEQKAWFKRTVEESDATFRLLISPTPLVGPDRGNKNDNHANAGFAHEGNELRRFLATQRNMIVVCGDRHWQYVSVDPATGLREYSCGPASDAHAGGWDATDVRPEHQYLKVVGGFLAGTVDRESGAAVLTLRHYSVDGELFHEDRIEAE